MSNPESSIPPDSPRFFKSAWTWLVAFAAVLTALVTIVTLGGQLIDGTRKLFASSPEHPSVSPPISAQGPTPTELVSPTPTTPVAPFQPRKLNKCQAEYWAKYARGDYDPYFMDRCLSNP